MSNETIVQVLEVVDSIEFLGDVVEFKDKSGTELVELETLVEIRELQSLDIVEVGVPGSRGPQGPPGDNQRVTVEREASIPLSGHRAVTARNDGTLEYADNATLAHLERPVWLTEGAISAGAFADVVAFGYVVESSWNWTPGEAIYLGANGVLTQTPPVSPDAAFLLEIARVLDADTIAFEPKLPIKLA